MTSKHYRSLAFALLRTLPRSQDAARLIQWQTDADAIADVLAELATPKCRFDRGKWADSLATKDGID